MIEIPLVAGSWVIMAAVAISLLGLVNHDTPAYYWKRLFAHQRRKRLNPRQQAAARAQAAIEDLATFKAARRQREIAAWMNQWANALPPEQKKQAVRVHNRDEYDRKEHEWKRIPERIRIVDGAGNTIAEYDGVDTAQFVKILRSDTPRLYLPEPSKRSAR